jgi:hypothetical protein
MSGYSTHSAEAFMTPENFITGFDGLNPAYAIEQYRKGLTIGGLATQIDISVSDVWSAKMRDGALRSSYEKLGYHAHTASLLQGFIDSGVKIVVWRDVPNDEDNGYTVTQFVIQEGNN